MMKELGIIVHSEGIRGEADKGDKIAERVLKEIDKYKEQNPNYIKLIWPDDAADKIFSSMPEPDEDLRVVLLGGTKFCLEKQYNVLKENGYNVEFHQRGCLWYEKRM